MRVPDLVGVTLLDSMTERDERDWSVAVARFVGDDKDADVSTLVLRGVEDERQCGLQPTVDVCDLTSTARIVAAVAHIGRDEVIACEGVLRDVSGKLSERPRMLDAVRRFGIPVLRHVIEVDLREMLGLV